MNTKIVLIKSYLECNKNVEHYYIYFDEEDLDCSISVELKDSITIKEARSLKKEFKAILEQLNLKYDCYPEDNNIDSWCFDCIRE